MKERPILFSGPMVRAILDGSKTQTRRVVKRHGDMEFDPQDPRYGPYWLPYAAGDAEGEQAKVRCPHGTPGDRLWVRETWAHERDGTGCPDDTGVLYRATDPGWDDEGTGLRWRPSVFMPRWASRILLEITDVRVQRLQGISEEDARAEGIEYSEGYSVRQHAHVGLAEGDWIPNAPPIPSFRSLWERIHGLNSWDANPWVWAITFQGIQP
jgi:hypothetical protein